MKEAIYTVQQEEGLHARPASEFCKTAGKFSSKITVEKNGVAKNAKSMLHILSLGVGKGETIRIAADGADEAEAMDALLDVLKNV